MKLLCNFTFSIFPLFDLILFNGLFRSAIGGFLSNFSFQFLESTPNIVAFGLLFSQFILELERHFVVAVLGLLKLDSSLMNLSQNVEIFMLIHGCFVGFVDENMIFVSDFFDFGLHHSVVVVKTIICIFCLADS